MDERAGCEPVDGFRALVTARLKLLQRFLSWGLAALLFLSIASTIRSGLDPRQYTISVPLMLLVAALAAGLILGRALPRRIAAGLCLLLSISVSFFPLVAHARPLDVPAFLLRAMPAVVLLLGIAYVLDYGNIAKLAGPQRTGQRGPSGPAF